jgi:mRNA interferase RelE/StbE
MPRYRLVISNRFRRDMRRLDAPTHRRVLEALATLEDNPRQGIRLTNVEIGQWRIRVGDWRIRYDIEEDQVLLYRVRHRRDIYRD